MKKRQQHQKQKQQMKKTTILKQGNALAYIVEQQLLLKIFKLDNMAKEL